MCQKRAFVARTRRDYGKRILKTLSIIVHSAGLDLYNLDVINDGKMMGSDNWLTQKYILKTHILAK